MRFIPVFLLASALVLGACDKGPKVDLKDATPAEVAKAIKDSGATRSMVRPGKWSSTAAILEMSGSGIPPEIQQRMKAAVGKPSTTEACLTADQVDHPERMLGNVPGNCKYERYQMGGGTINGTMRCEHQGMAQQMIVAGTYSDDHYSLTVDNQMTARQTGPAGQPAGGMRMKMKVDSRRLGECDGKQPA